MIDVAVALGLTLAGGTLWTLGARKPARRDSAYPVAGGRILLRARLASARPETKQRPLVGQVRDLLLEEGPVWQVRLLRSPRPGRGVLPSMIQGWEEPLVRPLSSALVATSLMSLALVGLQPQARPTGDPEAFPEARRAADRPEHEGAFVDSGRWERELLVADVGVPAPHTFRKRDFDPGLSGQGGTRFGTGGGSSGGTIVHGHANIGMIPHANTFTAHTNTAPPGYPPPP